MLNYNEILPKKYLLLDGEPHEVLEAQTTKKQRQKPVNQTKLRHLVTGTVTERAFHQSDKVEEAEIETRQIRYRYTRRGEWWFDDPNNPKERFALTETHIGEKGKFLTPDTGVDALVLDGKIIGIRLPVKVNLTVTDTPPGIKGNTAQGGTKQATLETGAVVSVPLFINVGDIVRVNTETGGYVERASKR